MIYTNEVIDKFYGDKVCKTCFGSGYEETESGLVPCSNPNCTATVKTSLGKIKKRGLGLSILEKTLGENFEETQEKSIEFILDTLDTDKDTIEQLRILYQNTLEAGKLKNSYYIQYPLLRGFTDFYGKLMQISYWNKKPIYPQTNTYELDILSNKKYVLSDSLDKFSYKDLTSNNILVFYLRVGNIERTDLQLAINILDTRARNGLATIILGDLKKDELEDRFPGEVFLRLLKPNFKLNSNIRVLNYIEIEKKRRSMFINKLERGELFNEFRL